MTQHQVVVVEAGPTGLMLAGTVQTFTLLRDGRGAR